MLNKFVREYSLPKLVGEPLGEVLPVLSAHVAQDVTPEALAEVPVQEGERRVGRLRDIGAGPGIQQCRDHGVHARRGRNRAVGPTAARPAPSRGTGPSTVQPATTAMLSETEVAALRKDIEDARAYGVDISLIRAGLRLTPEERLRSNDEMIEFFRGVRVTPGWKAPAPSARANRGLL
jgi:hypothetical protein